MYLVSIWNIRFSKAKTSISEWNFKNNYDKRFARIQSLIKVTKHLKELGLINTLKHCEADLAVYTYKATNNDMITVSIHSRVYHLSNIKNGHIHVYSNNTDRIISRSIFLIRNISYARKNPTYVWILCKIYNKTISKTSNGSDIASNSTCVLNRGIMKCKMIRFFYHFHHPYCGSCRPKIKNKNFLATRGILPVHMV